MLTKISLATGVVSAAIGLVVALGWWNLDVDQLGYINAFVLAVGAAIHSWFNPNVPIPGSVTE